ncbi:TVP38/TMEM64 family protein [Paenibacillus sp. JX-17]|uniref:TVP38/TMEM64 family membrane protein n=1 Tax=Paenibacillus lacisoli TaxID=3064525 RepID=A0ABT9CCH0_9BACL|nr:TVP38/TMEM64 family protein [Paenibacillus sp. JX-17]MDO7906354.1 TVP38/TMEM64 family protein [Paenibacillus sp. JX-17]
MYQTLEIMSYFTEEHLREWMDQYRSLGPLTGLLLAFMKSFVPPLPTILIVGLNAAGYGLWGGFLYSWLGLVAGCIVTFLLVRRAASTAWAVRWSQKPAVHRSLVWVRRNAFSYVFLLSMFPVGPFVVINIAAGVARMRTLSFVVAVSLGKAVMVFCVSYIGSNLGSYLEHPLQLTGVIVFVVGSLWICRRLETYFTSEQPDERKRSI